MKDIKELFKKKAKVLIADDDAIVRETISEILGVYGYEVELASCGGEAISKVDDSFDVIVLDINMPDLNGFETMDAIEKLGFNIPILFLTGAGSMDYAVKAINMGAYDFLTKPIKDLDLFNIQIKRAVEKRAYILREQEYKKSLEHEIRIKTAQLEKQNKLLTSYNKSIKNATVQLMASLQNAMEEKDYYTAGHTTRVTEYAVMLGLSMGISESDIAILRRAAQFHDIGKLVIDLSCIQKAGKLTDDEWALIKKHPEVGASIIEPLGFMDKEIAIIRHHHERMDGKGYPAGLRGHEIDELTRILTVVDSYDAMTSHRNYKENMTREQAVAELERCSGTQFDADIVKYFSRSIVDFTLSGKFEADKPLDCYLNYTG
ncbi:HD domain-containing phosphohydrolase [Desulfotalea psychrophila]|uniref:Related to two-component system response regulator (Ntr family) n=1 Tax=Desulfotalea psychrophila (strain LSv54 / DSM 12343) TaxID=177439 RepID=Q6AQJ9_DESPS|nr:HD domain-containing phosphohydrolase [Desulfotalea psychrophila]CAG35374.1 related to two-component system response regulator (Ntr family) [Desulfotalea psychrophila LSv54]